MKRCPVSLHLALIIVALFADDVKSTVQLLAAEESPAAAIHSDSSVPLAAIRLVDSLGTTFDGPRGSRPNRDPVVKPFAEVQVAGRRFPLGIASLVWQVPSAPSSLVAQHIRLQI